MTTFQKSLSWWSAGAAAGAVIGKGQRVFGKRRPVVGAILGAIAGAMIVGAVAVVEIERAQLGC